MNDLVQCGAFLERLQREHHCINGELIAIREELAKLRGSPTRQDMVNVSEHIQSLAQELKSHFDDGDDGYEAEVLSRCPSLTPEVSALRGERAFLLESIRELLSQTFEAEEHGRLWDAFGEFAARLRSHEVAENRVLQMAFGGDASDYDVEGNE